MKMCSSVGHWYHKTLIHMKKHRNLYMKLSFVGNSTRILNCFCVETYKQPSKPNKSQLDLGNIYLENIHIHNIHCHVIGYSYIGSYCFIHACTNATIQAFYVQSLIYKRSGYCHRQTGGCKGHKIAIDTDQRLGPCWSITDIASSPVVDVFLIAGCWCRSWSRSISSTALAARTALVYV